MLQVGDKYITQSSAIIEYLEEAFPEPPLLPTDLFERAQVRRIREIIGSDIQPVQNLRVMKKVCRRLFSFPGCAIVLIALR